MRSWQLSKPVHLASSSTAFLIHLTESDSRASRATFRMFNTSTLVRRLPESFAGNSSAGMCTAGGGSGVRR
jgi:hypothetical protein